MPIGFDAEQTAVSFPTRLLSLPIGGADPRRRAELVRQIDEIWSAGTLSLPDRLRRELRVALIKRHFSASEVAEGMGIARRTLDRRLAEAGLPFQAAMDEARCVYVKQLLSYTKLEVHHIATLVGYADPGTLSKAFSRWVGQTPSGWRASRALAQCV